MSSTIKVTKQTKEMLVRFAATLQKRYGRRVDLDEAIRHLLLRQEKKPEVLDSIIGSVPMISTEELYEERRLDEEKRARRYNT